LLLDTGDGVLNAAFISHILNETNSTLAELTKGVEMYPDKLVNLRGVDKELVKHHDVLQIVNVIKNELKNDGKVLVRASGTEPLIRISVSAPTETIVDEAIKRIVSTIEALSN
jgi:phosphoglucosamine mutase